ncbi:MAG: molybdopterin converting factor subunit 1 [Chloroflexi bacterium]|jgi:molybdopterin converting factor subunit 1|nr:molybdopterin converting factor subunit 1 [Chloroflexota bacterium]
MRLTVVYYGGLKQETGVKRETLDLPGEALTVHELNDLLSARYPALGARLQSVAYAVNDTLIDGDTLLRDGDEASLLPPVSGG